MSKKGRKIVVIGQLFYWEADWTYHNHQRIIQLAVWREQGRGVTLRANLTNKKQVEVDSAYVMPKEVASVISYGLEHGWEPHVGAGSFWLDQNATLELENLKLTNQKMGLSFNLSGNE